MTSFVNKISRALKTYQQFWTLVLRDPRSPDCLALACSSAQVRHVPEIEKLDENAILWNTPKSRKTVEKRKKASFGSKEWGGWKPLVPNRRLRVRFSKTLFVK
jgi:hypothetical protein